MPEVTDKILSFMTRIFGSHNERMIKKILPIVEKTNSLEPEFKKYSNEELKNKTIEFKERLSKNETLDDILPEAFAAVREASIRTTTMRHFDVQLIGGYVLHSGNIAEMATGEGKTLVATLAAYLNALSGKGVHLVTVNDYLARRDAQWMGPIYYFLGLNIGVIQHDYDVAYLYNPEWLDDTDSNLKHLMPCERKEAYLADITYGTNNNFGFDYLRDNMKVRAEDQVQRELHYAIIDEVDSILIDEARTPLIISGSSEESTEKYYVANRVAKQLQKDVDYEVNLKDNQAILTEEGIVKAQRIVGVDDFYSGTNMAWPHHIEQALRAKELYKRDKEYVVKEGEVVIVDQFTGRLMPGRKWSDGLHQAIEAKEGQKIKEENQTLATITIQNYYKLYKKLAGMTGTALTEAGEFDSIYKLDVISIPTNKQLKRLEYPDIVFGTEEEKFDAIVEEIAKTNQKGRPILVGTTSIENSERLSKMLDRRGIKHEVLNAKHHEREASIIKKAGEPGQVTIATNMAGRGTDIVLGEGVAELGGLHVLGTERHEARRIDNQLRGRAGRQGDPGSSRFILSLEDEMLKIFAPEWASNILKKMGLQNGQPIESKMISRTIGKAQEKMETHNFDIRKHLLEYDEVANEQRKTIYALRQQALTQTDLRDTIHKMIKEYVYDLVDKALPLKVKTEWDYSMIISIFDKRFHISISLSELENRPIEEIEELLINKLEERYKQREEDLTPEEMRRVERYILLRIIDDKWKEHLYAIDYLKAGIGLRGYAQIDPKIAFKKEAYELFENMVINIRRDIVQLVMNIKLASREEEKQDKLANVNYVKNETSGYVSAKEGGKQPAQRAKPKPITAGKKVGRNDPCPCGSGKKFKKCCGA